MLDIPFTMKGKQVKFPQLNSIEHCLGEQAAEPDQGDDGEDEASEAEQAEPDEGDGSSDGELPEDEEDAGPPQENVEDDRGAAAEEVEVGGEDIDDAQQTHEDDPITLDPSPSIYIPGLENILEDQLGEAAREAGNSKRPNAEVLKDLVAQMKDKDKAFKGDLPPGTEKRSTDDNNHFTSSESQPWPHRDLYERDPCALKAWQKQEEEKRQKEADKEDRKKDAKKALKQQQGYAALKSILGGSIHTPVTQVMPAAVTPAPHNDDAPMQVHNKPEVTYINI